MAGFGMDNGKRSSDFCHTSSVTLKGFVLVRASELVETFVARMYYKVKAPTVAHQSLTIQASISDLICTA